ncbi:aminotransferase IV [Hymenobacter gummosus]|uniref:branched-chain-amino-acid transaminase n=1 Tax=Hymenobacter gummosus TaxID=1776032 RepID=A0A431TVZ2_9BACT|nr:aminotransferase class IV [Hymenobacter gummosus]RTQ45603.1 aminotransferase IV [Hymenobacter gummosus]
MSAEASTLAMFDGELLPLEAVRLPLPNRGLQFNDGFFETLICAGGRVKWLPDHAARLQRAAAALHLDLPASLSTPAALGATLTRFAAASGVAGPVRLRLQLWRGGGGLYAPPTANAHWLLTAAPFTPHDALIAQASFATGIRTQFSPLSFCKGPYALHYVLAAQERQARGLDELLLLDAHGHVAEAVAAAVFWLKNGVLYTPSLESGCVAGIRRAHLLRVARAHGLPCQEGLFAAAELLTAEAAFTANVAGIRAVAQIESVLFAADHPLLADLRRWEAV